jgi:transcriptional regulator with GAF, ATPase, and Fis domain
MKDTPPSTLVSNGSDGAQERAERSFVLHVVSDTGVSTIALSADQVLRIGRRRDSDVVLTHPSASRDHAILHWGETPEIEDLGSANGTRVNGVRMPTRARLPLPPGSLVSIAETSLFLRQSSGQDPEPATPRPKSSPFGAPAGKSPSVLPRDPTMLELYGLAERVAQSSMTVLILGETGVGKELLAERLHAHSTRRERPMLRVNCAALAEGILASELFGHERGAFTGAHATKIGLFEAAHGSTVFLDEVGELTQETQAKLLRVLETGEVTRVGSHQQRQVDVRVISATNRDLRQYVAAGRFRADLWYRLNGVTVTVPPLRDHPADILPLAQHFAARCAEMMAAPAPSFSEEARAALMRYRWPGNIRELKNVVERAVVLSPRGVLEPSDFQLETSSTAISVIPPSSAPTTPPSIDYRRSASLRPSEAGIRSPGSDTARSPESIRFDTGIDRAPRSRSHARLKANRRAEQLREELARAERERIVEALNQAGNQAAAAKLLGISRRALLYRLDAYGIQRPRKRNPRQD